MSSLLVLFLACLAGSSFGAVEVIQNGTYILEYGLVNNETLTVTATVATQGWVGVGLSQTGSMVGADLILGGVNADGEEYINDYFAVGNARPIVDLENNILTYNVTENATHTTLFFTRAADTGDIDEDLPVSRSSYIIWAFSDSDSFAHHGTERRGAIPLSL
ncbi:DBH-like monooxygenase protein 2 [Orchesella cincta]|uniref:DBH-like monooxygenase protein 2 n=1 Tax=Orchesella cincta TaxID=48709 RepID=A0A1D2N610_ORCCI|nr:DBH-like monooxygenase protein 2 [Orchesella cincta]